MTRWDSVRARRRSESRGRDPRTCIHCGADAYPRFMFCSDEHSEASRAAVVQAFTQRARKAARL